MSAIITAAITAGTALVIGFLGVLFSINYRLGRLASADEFLREEGVKTRDQVESSKREIQEQMRLDVQQLRSESEQTREQMRLDVQQLRSESEQTREQLRLDVQQLRSESEQTREQLRLDVQQLRSESEQTREQLRFEAAVALRKRETREQLRSESEQTREQLRLDVQQLRSESEQKASSSCAPKASRADALGCAAVALRKRADTGADAPVRGSIAGGDAASRGTYAGGDAASRGAYPGADARREYAVKRTCALGKRTDAGGNTSPGRRPRFSSSRFRWHDRVSHTSDLILPHLYQGGNRLHGPGLPAMASPSG